MAKKHTNKIEKKLLIAGLALFVAVTCSVIYSLVFLSNQMLLAFSEDTGRSAQVTKFDIEGFEKLGL